MTVRQETMHGSAGASPGPQTPSPFLLLAAKRLRGIGPRYAAIAPGRLNVMGGVSDFTGALVLQQPTAAHCCVVVQRSAEEKLTLCRLTGPDESEDHEIPMNWLYSESRGWLLPQEADASLNGHLSAPLRCALATVVEAMREKLLPPLSGGLSIGLGTDLDVGHGQQASVASACLVATAVLLNVELDPWRAARLCQKVENEWLKAPLGWADACCALLGEPSALLEVRGDAYRGTSTIPCPDVRLVGIDCGVVDEGWENRLRGLRAASHMGAILIDRIIRHDKLPFPTWDGKLSRVSVHDYVEHFRDRLPTRIKGRDFVSRFGPWNDSCAPVEPAAQYKIRSRTEHHIYENARAHQFVEALSRGQRVGDLRAMLDAGDLMTASHWSYGQRCGLGHVLTDLLVNLIREHGVNKDIYGVKVSGRGCGGIVCAMLKSTDRAWSALDESLTAYRAKTGRQPRILDGAAHPGAMLRGAIKL